MRPDQFLKRARRIAPVVVLSGDEVGLGIVRDLGIEGVPVLTMGSDARSPAFHSRYCAAKLCPDPHYDETGLVKDLMALGALLPQRGVVLPAHDDYVVALSRHKDRLQEWFAVPVLSWGQMRSLADKHSQLQLAAQAGLDVPAGALIACAGDIGAAAESIPFPAILKPTVPMALVRRTGQKAVFLEDSSRLHEEAERLLHYGPMLLQEVVPGGDDSIFIAGCYLDPTSRCLAMFTGRKIRQHPVRFGVTRLGESLWVPQVAQLALRLLEALGYQGIADVEFKRDPRDGRYKLMEINARQGFWGPLATAAGVNLPYVAYLDSTRGTAAVCEQRDGVRWADLLLDGPDSLGEWRRGETTALAWLRSLRGLRVDAYFSVRDPEPAVMEVARLGRSLLRGAARRARRVVL